MNTSNIEANINKTFRISAKRIFLTYSQVNEECTSEHILELLNEKLHNIAQYIIAKEKHEDGNTPFMLYLFRKINLRSKKAANLIYK